MPQADESTPPVANSGVQTDHQKLTFGQRVRSAMPSWEKVDHPYQKYEENINAAIAGEADSQFIVAQSLELCLYETSLTPESRKECSALRARIGEIRVDEAVSWYEAAAESNYALAVLKVRALDEFGVEERTRILVDALSTKNPAVFDVLATYFSARQLSGDTEFIAWNYYSCYYSQRCDEGNFLNNLLIGGFEHELNMVVERIEEIGCSIRNENWAALVPDY